MKKISIGLLAILLVACTTSTDSDRIEDLLDQMTLDEKIGQLNQYTGRWEMTGPAPDNDWANAAVEKLESGELGSMLNVVGAEATRNAQQMAVENSRLGIPMIFGYDVIHGYQTMFPIPLGETATWEPELARKSSAVAAAEASAAGLHWTFAPMVDISRDARWGRGMEGSGEDPYLGSLFAKARVIGFQGEDLAKNNTIAACAKHFAAYGFVEAGREYNTVDVSEHTLRNVIFPPFKACIDAGVATFMNSFNEIGGTPATSSTWLQRDILKGEWNFDGFVVSDWNSIGELIAHGVAADRKEAAKLAIMAGSDMDMEGYCYESGLKELVESGEVDESLVDDAVRRILGIKEKLGLLDDPFRYCDPEREKAILLHPDHLALSREIAKRSMVLLRNEGSILPLSKDGLDIALIGELAADKDSPLGNWRAQAIKGSAVSIMEGLESATGSSRISYEKGPDYAVSESGFLDPLSLNETDPTGISEAVALAGKSDVAILVLGENGYQSAEARSVAHIKMKGFQEELLREVLKVQENVVVVLMNGRALDITEFAMQVPAIVVAWQPGSEAGNAVADVLFGDYNPSGKLPFSWPRSLGQLPLYYNFKNTGRPYDGSSGLNLSRYTDESNDPLYPFGYGLSYTSFEYSRLTLSDTLLGETQALEIKVTVENSGKVAGEEVVQLYVRDKVGSVSRPMKELKGFEKIALKAGASRELTFTLTQEDLHYFGANGTYGIEPGTIQLWVGPHSGEGLEASFEIQ